LARSRLERECAVNQLLHSNGFKVPKILHVSHAERLVFKEYIEGEKLDKIIRNILKSENEDFLKAISRVGETFAKAHTLDIALGDTKPENIIVRQKTGEVCLLDLEQASRKGDKAWDIAEFLYYSGHYIPPWAGTRPAQLITEAFIAGYIGAGGDPHLIKKASNPKYTKVFSVFTLPHIIMAISNICRKANELKEP
jgi:tRNA A-37 threonylcarbamoyl transferase component Bud32